MLNSQLATRNSQLKRHLFALTLLFSGAVLIAVAFKHWLAFLRGADNSGAVIFYVIVGLILIIRALFLKNKYHL